MVLVLYECVRHQHSRDPRDRIASLVSKTGEMFQMAADLPLVPGDQNRFDIREIFVQRRAATSRLFGDLRHRHGRQPMLGYQRRSGVDGRIAHRAAVHLDRVDNVVACRSEPPDTTHPRGTVHG